MRGYPIEKPIPVADLAERCGITLRSVGQYARYGHVKVEVVDGVQTAMSGMIPLERHVWEDELWDVIRDKRHLAGFYTAGGKRFLQFLDGDRVREMLETRNRLTLNRQIKTVRAVLFPDEAEATVGGA